MYLVYLPNGAQRNQKGSTQQQLRTITNTKVVTPLEHITLDTYYTTQPKEILKQVNKIITTMVLQNLKAELFKVNFTGDAELSKRDNWKTANDGAVAGIPDDFTSTSKTIETFRRRAKNKKDYYQNCHYNIKEGMPNVVTTVLNGHEKKHPVVLVECNAIKSLRDELEKNEILNKDRDR